MSLNDREILKQSAKGDIYPGFANPTTSSNSLMPTDPREANFVQDPATPNLGAGVTKDFKGHKVAQRMLNKDAGVIEHHPGIIESTNIEPLKRAWN